MKNKIILYFFLALITMLLLHYERVQEFLNLSIYSCADGLVNMSGSLYFILTLVPISSLLIADAIRYDFIGSRVLFYRSVSDIFRKQKVKVLFYAVLTTLIFCGVILVYEYMQGAPLFKWSMQDSYYYAKNGKVFGGSFIKVLLLFSVVTTIRIYILGMVVVLLNWHFNSVIPGIAFNLLLSLLDISGIKVIALIANRFTFDYEIWQSKNSRLAMCIVLVVYLFIFKIIEIKVVKEKEFISEHKSA